MTLPSALVRPVTPFTRVVFTAAAGLAAIAGIQLYLLTDYTDHCFAWTIAAPLSAAFLGTGYWTGTVLLLFAARERDWASIRVALAAVATFVPLMLLTTLLHLDRFHLAGSDTNAVVAGWAWVIVYALVPAAVPAVLIVQLRQPGGDPPVTQRMSTRLKTLIAINAGISLVVAGALFVAPGTMDGIWPWKLTPLTAQAIGTVFFAVVGASVWFLREDSLGRARGGTVAYTLIGLLQIVAIARYSGTIDWSRLASWLYVAFMAAIFVGGLSGTAAAWLPRIRRSEVAEA